MFNCDTIIPCLIMLIALGACKLGGTRESACGRQNAALEAEVPGEFGRSVTFLALRWLWDGLGSVVMEEWYYLWLCKGELGSDAL